MKKSVLVFTAHVDNLSLDEAYVQLTAGNKVYLLLCDKSFGVCNWNNASCGLSCSLCHHVMIKKVKELKKRFPELHLLSLKDIITKEIVENAANKDFSYENVAELKAISYKHVDIGFGAFSTFATATRNIMPTFNDAFKNYIDFVMRKEMCMTDAIINLYEKYHFDMFVFHNGRFSTYKPFHNLAQHYGIEYIATELAYDSEGNMRKDYYHNDIPLSYDAMARKAIEGWEEGKKDNKEELSRQFFENRRNGAFAGDVIYTKDQKKGLLPDDYQEGKENIVIFNSSEDEFFSVSHECDNAVIFPNQYIGLTKILEHYKGDETKHFYLRIHPNLKTVPWKSHTLLYKLKYDNLTIVPPDSPISSYALMDIADKVIVFNSTMGVECSYWEKPVIALSKCFYTALDVVYTPKDEIEVYKLLDGKLASKKNENCLKAAYFLMGYVTEPFVYYSNKVKKVTFRGKALFDVQSQFKLFGSSFLLGFVERILAMSAMYIGKYNHLGEKTA